MSGWDRVHKPGSGPSRVSSMRVGSTPRRILIAREEISYLWHYEDCTHKENGTVNMEYTVILDISTIALNRVGYLGSAPPHLFLTCPGRVSVPTTVPTHVPFQRNINCHSNQERILWKNLIACTDILALTKVIQLLS